MTTAPSTLVNLQNKLTKEFGTTNDGIVGNAEHVATGGYHIGAASLRANGMSNDYSLTLPIDNVSHDYACAIDVGGSASLLMKLGNRLVHALKNQDPRVYNRIRATNAPYDGQSVDRRYDTQAPNNPKDDHTETSSDRNHIHIEFYRSLVTQQTVMDGLFSVLSGEEIDDMEASDVINEPIKNPESGSTLSLGQRILDIESDCTTIMKQNNAIMAKLGIPPVS